ASSPMWEALVILKPFCAVLARPGPRGAREGGGRWLVQSFRNVAGRAGRFWAQWAFISYFYWMRQPMALVSLSFTGWLVAMASSASIKSCCRAKARFLPNAA